MRTNIFIYPLDFEVYGNEVKVTYHLPERWKGEHKLMFVPGFLLNWKKKKKIQGLRDSDLMESFNKCQLVSGSLFLNSALFSKIAKNVHRAWRLMPMAIFHLPWCQSSYCVKTDILLKKGSFRSKYFSFEGKTKKVGEERWELLYIGTIDFPRTSIRKISY